MSKPNVLQMHYLKFILLTQVLNLKQKFSLTYFMSEQRILERKKKEKCSNLIKAQLLKIGSLTFLWEFHNS